MGANGPVGIALIGDHNPEVTAHRAIPLALARAGREAGLDLRLTWIHTASIPQPLGDFLDPFDGVWCVPASPYASMAGALCAIRHARESHIPFLGTCGGFQHAVIEYARNVLGLSGAAHAESDPGAAEAVVTPLACSLVERSGVIDLLEGSRAKAMSAATSLHEEYHCSYGLNPAYEAELERSGLRVTGRDPAGEARVIELEAHPFYLATLFQPERAALRGVSHPFVGGFAAAAAHRHNHREHAWTTSAIPSDRSGSPAR